MGVMACSRNNCSNILCDTYKEDVGYICNECIQEFKDLIGSNKLPVFEMKEKFKTFINTEKYEGTEYNHNEISTDDFFK